ncbi:hypothetical protein BGZ89_005190 [Linnemannia elongata]|nr:hypothetical protein BGZ89_005190 [Linnemannia elongata]
MGSRRARSPCLCYQSLLGSRTADAMEVAESTDQDAMQALDPIELRFSPSVPSSPPPEPSTYEHVRTDSRSNPSSPVSDGFRPH